MPGGLLQNSPSLSRLRRCHLVQCGLHETQQPDMRDESRRSRRHGRQVVRSAVLGRGQQLTACRTGLSGGHRLQLCRRYLCMHPASCRSRSIAAGHEDAPARPVCIGP
ncbi:hypothetical protein C5746_06600 [Streptomyces atratus]|uniref:Uncharacterized protein n=1 Tax=Streptomyces atratus TaxID=1893 RepID=A0A2Z5J8G3_STRAR|nr:hypothetical protein C5746_06600 [Streptomyces atratus]